MASHDQGNVLSSATGTAITASYNASTTSAAKYGGRASQVDVFLTAVTAVGSPIVNVTINMRVRYDPTDANDWHDVQSTRHDNGTEAAEHVWNIGAAPQTKRLFVTCIDASGAVGGIQVRVKGDAIGIAGDSIEADMTFA